MTKYPLFCSAVSIFYVLLGSLIFAQEQRTWTDDTGKFKIEAKLQRVEDDKVFLEKSDGKISSIPLAKLSKEDREYLDSLKNNPFADEDENPFAEDMSTKPSAGNTSAARQTSGGGFDMEPKLIVNKGVVSYIGANNTSWNCQPDVDSTPSFDERPPTVQFGIEEMPIGTNVDYDVVPYLAGGKPSVLAAVKIKLSRMGGGASRSPRPSARNRTESPKQELTENETRFVFCNLETGEMQNESVPYKISLLDVSPDGTTAVFRSGDWDYNESGKKNVLYIADIASRKVKVLHAFAPFDNERSEYQRDITDAAMIDKDTVLIRGNSLIVFNVKNNRVVWRTDKASSAPAFSANKKYCIVNGSMLEAATGKSVGKFETDNDSGAFSFSPDGKTVAYSGLIDRNITFFDALTGQGSEPVFIDAYNAKPLWTNNQFILIFDKLIDSKTKAVVWKYNSPQFYFGGYTWYLCGMRSDRPLVPAKLPHPAAAVNALKPEWALAPGKEAVIKIDGSITDRKSEIFAHLENALKDNGVRIKDNAPIVVEASVKKEAEKSVFYVTNRGFGMPFSSPMFSRPGEEGTEIKYIPEVFSVQIKKGDKVYWGTSRTKAPPQNISLDE
ncbi:MAG: SHD1 domain-containing protein, partial [Planctomycetaceae bacterium]|nr:SHD1 domain-containing protein [Planctomycetaceae bacterium]